MNDADYITIFIKKHCMLLPFPAFIPVYGRDDSVH